MSALKGFGRGRGRRFWASGATLAVVAVFAVVFVAASGAVLPGSPSGFESNDGNMTLETSGNTDWNCFRGGGGFQPGSPPAGCNVMSGAEQLTADANGEITWVNGNKFDTLCPALETGNVPAKDDFTHVASYGEIASNHDAFFYGATIRAVANGDSSGDVEFNQHAGDGITTAGCRTAGDLLLAYDFSNGGTTLDFHILTWIDNSNPGVSDKLGGNNGTCFVNQDSMPCWGANELTPSAEEGLTNQAAIAAADNGISGTNLVAQQFAEFGVNLTQALGLTATCLSFPQLVWESRTSQSFTSNPEDIEIEHKTINTCATPTVVTHASVTGTGVVGTDSTSDTATVSGGDNPGGTIQFSITAPDNTTSNVGAAVTVNGDGTYNAPSSVALTEVGTYTWHASYSGDSHNNEAADDGTNESVTSIKASPTVVTHASETGTGVVGTDSTSDTATVSGGDNPGGTIQFSITAPDNTTSNVGAAVTVNGDGTYNAPSSVALTEVGTYTWHAAYTGDGLNNGAADDGTNESVTSIPASPSVTTVADPSAGPVGVGQVSDTATFSGGFQLSGDSVDFTLYNDPSCDPANATSVAGSALIDGNGQATFTGNASSLPAGTYYWGVSFAGDDNNNPASECGGDEGVENEVLIIGQASPSVATTLSESAGMHGDTVHDSAKLTGATANAGGTVTYSVYSDSSCTNKVADGGTVNVTNGSVPNSNNVTFNTPGTYYWQASYSGDTNNQAAVSVCTDEKLVIAPIIDLAVTKTGSPNPITIGNGNIAWTMVVTNNGPDTATGVNISDPLPAGTTFVSVSTSQGSCTGGAIISCSLGTMAAGATVTITLVTTPNVEGTVSNTVMVVGNEHESNTANNTATASVVVKGFTPPVVCVAVSKVTPKQLFVGRKTKVTIHVTQGSKAVKGIHVQIKGPKTNIKTGASNSKGVITQNLKMKKAGILVFSPIASKKCNTKRVGVTGVFTPPVTG